MGLGGRALLNLASGVTGGRIAEGWASSQRDAF